ncbi:MAG: ABC transporter substrate-binding protein [Vicinamibacterales bacterium]
MRRHTFWFYLRRDIAFHDGQELTAENVKFTFDQISGITTAGRSPRVR